MCFNDYCKSAQLTSANLHVSLFCVMTKLNEYLPIRSKKTTSISARVPTELVLQVRAILDLNRLSWADFITAMCRQFLDENGKSKR